MSNNWSSAAVKSALIEAFTIDKLIGGRVGPKQYGSAMPAYYDDWRDLYIAELLDNADPEHGGTGGLEWARMQAERRAEMQRKRRVTAAEISRMERILLGVGKEPAWLHGLLSEEDRSRMMLEAYSVQSALFSLRGYDLKERRLCKKMKWPYSTFRDRREEGASIISWKLNRFGIQCWVEGEGSPDTDPRNVPLTVVLLEFLKAGPATKYQFVSFCYHHRVIPSRDMKNQAVTVAIAKLVAGNRIRKRPDLAYERI